MPCYTDGIIGSDFLRKYNAIINYSIRHITLQTKTQKSVIQLETKTSNNIFVTLPARSESVHFLNIDSCLQSNREYLILPKELSNNIFLASIIVKPQNGKIPVRILNVNDNDMKLPIFTPELEPVSDYNILSFVKSNSSVERVTKLLQILKLDHLDADIHKQILGICAKYSDIFYLEGDKLSTTNIMTQSIDLKTNTKPIYVKPYRLPNAMKPEVDKQIRKMLADDIIEETNSDWNSPILLVPKKSDNNEKKWRLVIDYRKVNSVIQNDKFPLPHIAEILDSLSGAIYFTHLDLQQSYYQTKLDSDSRKITAFTTNTGQYQMKRLPMGLKISPSAFSRVMSVALSGLTCEKAFIYMDDIIVFGRNIESHNKNLIDVFERLRKVNLKINPCKCEFLKPELLYLGHVVSAEGVSPDPEKIRVLKNYPEPTNADETRRFVAFCNYYRRFIPFFAQITIPLNKLCKKHVTFIWTTECKQAFEHLKQALISPPILQYPDFSHDNEFILQTDASGTAIGSVLCNKDRRPIAYASRPLNKAELNYPTIQKELLAVVWSVKHFRPYLYGKSFTILTDHKPLLYLFSMKDPASRLIKFRLQLEEYDYKVTYIRGKDNTSADALSRVTITSDELKQLNETIFVMTRAQKRKNEEEEKVVSSSRNTSFPNISPQNSRPDQPRIGEIFRIPCDSVEMKFIERKDLDKLRVRKQITKERQCFVYVHDIQIIYINLSYISHFTRDEFANMLSDFCKEIKVEKICIKKTKDNALFIKKLLKEIQGRKLWSGPQINILNKNVKIIVDDKEKTIILNDFHLLPTSGHAGVRRMVNNIKRKYYWPGLEKSVGEYVKKCIKCQTMKYSRNIKEPMVITTTANSAFDKIFLDVVGPMDTDIEGNTYILTVQCELTKYIEAYPLQRKDTVSIARTLVNNFILRYGIPKVIATDRGSEFTSSTMEEVCQLLQISKLHSTAYHHQSIGSLENMHKHLVAYLRIQCDGHPEAWSQWLPFWCFVYNTSVHTSTKYSPFELVFGKQCNIPSNLKHTVEPLYNPDNYMLELKYRLQTAQKDAKRNLLNSKLDRKRYYDKNVNTVTYNRNELILVRNETGNKLNELYKGPYMVVDDIGPNVKIKYMNGKIDIVNKNRTKPYIT